MTQFKFKHLTYLVRRENGVVLYRLNRMHRAWIAADDALRCQALDPTFKTMLTEAIKAV